MMANRPNTLEVTGLNLSKYFNIKSTKPLRVHIGCKIGNVSLKFPEVSNGTKDNR